MPLNSSQSINMSRIILLILPLQCKCLENIRDPYPLQTYTWPAIFKLCFDVVGVSPVGKSTSYLLPLSVQLQSKDIYSSLPKCGLGVSVCRRFAIAVGSVVWWVVRWSRPANFPRRAAGCVTDHFVGKASAISYPTRPFQASVRSGSSNYTATSI